MTTWKRTTLSEAYSQREPNELEQRLIEQAKPGAIPSDPAALRFALAHIAWLPATDPRRQLMAKRHANGEELSENDLATIFGTNENLA